MLNLLLLGGPNDDKAEVMVLGNLDDAQREQEGEKDGDEANSTNSVKIWVRTSNILIITKLQFITCEM